MSNTRLRLNTSQKVKILDEYCRYLCLKQEELGEWAQKEFKLQQPVPQQTISNIIKASDKIYAKADTDDKAKSLKSPRYPELDSDVEKFISQINESNLPINREIIMRYAKRQSVAKYQIPEGTIKFSH
ncbi:hypothetical protein BD560DRAFT_342743, partial [Blakeslea trispora]